MEETERDRARGTKTRKVSQTQTDIYPARDRSNRKKLRKTAFESKARTLKVVSMKSLEHHMTICYVGL